MRVCALLLLLARGLAEDLAQSVPSHPQEPALPPIFVISLDRDTERWENVHAQMRLAGLNVTRLSAVDGRALTEEQLRSQSTRLAVLLQPRGVIGCFLSHRKFWQLVVDRNLSEAIVFEDDVRLVHRFRPLLAENLARLRADNHSYDVLLLGAIGKVNFHGRDGLGARLFSAYVGGSRRRLRIEDYLYQPSRPAGTHAYMVSQAGARRLLQGCPLAVFHVDLVAWALPSLSIRMFHPMLAYQTFEETTLTDVGSSRGRLADRLVRTRHMQRVSSWAVDATTLQPLSHMLAEPLLKLGAGPVLTVERHLAVVGLGAAAAALALRLDRRALAGILCAASLSFTVAVRALISLLTRRR